mgnify:CR=1 FL=1
MQDKSLKELIEDLRKAIDDFDDSLAELGIRKTEPIKLPEEFIEEIGGT